MTCFLVTVKYIERCHWKWPFHSPFSLSRTEVWKKTPSGYCHECVWRWLDVSVLSFGRTVLSIEAEQKQEMEILAAVIFSYSQVRGYQHICTGLRLGNKGFFWIERGLLFVYGLHLDYFGLCVKLQNGRCKRQDCKL